MPQVAVLEHCDLVLCHAGVALERVAEDPSAFLYPFLDESEDDLESVIDWMGADRVLFGSDWPHIEALPEPLDYAAPTEGAALPAGSFVQVSLGPRKVIGVVWDEARDAVEPALPVERLKPIEDVLPAPPLRLELRRFIGRVAAYTLSPTGAVLRMAMSVPDALLPPPPRRVCGITEAGLTAIR